MAAIPHQAEIALRAEGMMGSQLSAIELLAAATGGDQTAATAVAATFNSATDLKAAFRSVAQAHGATVALLAYQALLGA